MPDVGMPRLSDSMREGAVSQWLVTDGTQVTRGQEILEVETDKATMTYEAEHDGLLRILVGEGVNVEVGHVIATIGEPDARPTAPPTPAPQASPPRTPTPSPTGPPPRPATIGPAAGPSRKPRRADLTPLLRRLAQEHGVDPEAVQGTGPGGKVLRSDIVGAAAKGPDPVGAAAGGPDPVVAAGGSRVPLTRSQRLVASRMTESKQAIPDFWASASIDVTSLLELRSGLKAPAGQRVQSIVPTLNDFVVRACALALVEHPRLNTAYDDGHVVSPDTVNIGVAVATDTGLLVPVIRSTDRLDVFEIAERSASLVAAARSGKITVPSLEGGTFTVSNLGSFGVRSFAPIINARQGAIVGVGAATPAVVPVDGAIVVRSMLEVTLTSDHRIVYGADAGRFLQTLRHLLESPVALLLRAVAD